VKRTTKYIIGAAVVLAGIFGTGVAMRSVLFRMACITEDRLKIENLSGVSFEIIYTSCDTLAKEENISVFARKTDPMGAGIFSRWRNKRTLLFSYDPSKPDGPLPSITRPSQSTILISIPEVSSILDQTHEWANITVNYDIGRVYNPPALKQCLSGC